MPNIDIAQSSVTNHSQQVSNSANLIQPKSLSPVDDESTIKGVQECQEAFAKGQEMLGRFASLVQAEGAKIQQFGEQYAFVDDQLANMVKQISG